MTTPRIYNRKRAIPKDEDNSVHFKISPRIVSTVQSIDLRPQMFPVENQRELGSCSSYAVGAAYKYNQIKQKEVTPFTPSHLFLYYCERELEGTIHEDSGARLSTGVEVVSKIGVVPESDWPYTISKFTLRPPDSVYERAKSHRCDGYYRVGQTQDQIHQALINGFPVIIGIQIYSSFEQLEVAKTGIVPMPSKGEECLGGHAVLLVGFDNATQRYLARNSWGPNWGMKGYFTIPYLYIVNPDYADDIWVLTSVTDTETMIPMKHFQLRDILNKLEEKIDSFGQTLIGYVDNIRTAASEANICPDWLCENNRTYSEEEKRMSIVNQEIANDIQQMIDSLPVEPESEQNVESADSPKINNLLDDPRNLTPTYGSSHSTPQIDEAAEPSRVVLTANQIDTIVDQLRTTTISNSVQSFITDLHSKLTTEISRKSILHKI